ncbi:MAG: hypothetical protein NVV68_06510 [Dokdonella sp.]|nr:hypothetical protein [Dokdonella sp.]
MSVLSASGDCSSPAARQTAARRAERLACALELAGREQRDADVVVEDAGLAVLRTAQRDALRARGLQQRDRIPGTTGLTQQLRLEQTAVDEPRRPAAGILTPVRLRALQPRRGGLGLALTKQHLGQVVAAGGDQGRIDALRIGVGQAL